MMILDMFNKLINLFDKKATLVTNPYFFLINCLMLLVYHLYK